MALGIVPGVLDSAAKAFVDQKAELDKEKAAQITAQIEVNVLTQVVKDLKFLLIGLSLESPLLKTRLNT
jgi:hypothetical protein